MFLRDLENNVKECVLDIAFMMASADGVFSGDEKSLIKAYQSEMGINYEPKTRDKKEIISILNAISLSERKKIVFEIAALAMIDGVYANEEKEMLEKLADDVGIEIAFIVNSFTLVDELKSLYKRLLETVA